MLNRFRPIIVSLLLTVILSLAFGTVTAAASCVAISPGTSISSDDHVSAPLTSDPCGTTDEAPEPGVSIPILPLAEQGYLTDLLHLDWTRAASSDAFPLQMTSQYTGIPEAPPPNS
jgi:hypothetical protein